MKKNFIVAVDLGGTNLKVALFSGRFKIKAREVLSTRSFTKKEDLIAAIIYIINKIAGEWGLRNGQILGVGLGLPGPVDAQRGIVHFFPNIPGWREVNLKKVLQKKLGLPVFVDNDANLMALAEQRLGRAKGFKNSLCLTLGTGIGGGIILERKLFRGANNVTGEMGHVPINEIGPRCNCGGIACLEVYIGNNRIKIAAKKLFKRDISLEELSLLAKRGHNKARGLWQTVGRRLGIALTGVVNMLNLDAIVIGGGVAEAGKVLFDAVKMTIRKRAMRIQAKNIRVLKAKLGSDAGLIGAAILVRNSAP